MTVAIDVGLESATASACDADNGDDVEAGIGQCDESHGLERDQVPRFTRARAMSPRQERHWVDGKVRLSERGTSRQSHDKGKAFAKRSGALC
jgi:hypothetical protein